MVVYDYGSVLLGVGVVGSVLLGVGAASPRPPAPGPPAEGGPAVQGCPADRSHTVSQL